MGQEPALKLGQRGQDARQEVPMRPPQPFYAHERIMYHPELLTGPHWGELLVLGNSLAWDKTVPRLARVLSVASRPGCGRHTTWAGSRMRRLSAEGQGIALPGSTYGSDGLVRMGWWRQEYRATYRVIHTELSSQIRIAESHVGSLYQQGSLPRLACHERQHRAPLAQMAQQPGGLIVALDGLALQGGEPPMWFIRVLSRGLTWRRGWLYQQDQPTFEACLAPLTHLEGPILAVLSAKPKGVVPAGATVLPRWRYQFCQAHYRRNLAEPLAAADSACKGELRHAVRQQIGDLLRQEPRTVPRLAGVLTVTGRLPSPLAKPTAPASHRPPPRDTRPVPASAAAEVITPLFRPTRSWLTRKGRPPFQLAGMETYERLQNVARLRLALLATRYEPRLAPLSQGLQSALSPLAPTYQEFRQGASWLRDSASILEPPPLHRLSAENVAGQLRGYLDTVLRLPAVPPAFYKFGLHLDTGSRSYWPGLFHCYAVPGVPRTNNELESRCRDRGHRLLRTTGHKGLTQRTLQRQGAWELLLCPLTEAQLLRALCQTPPEELAQGRQRFAAQRQRFRLHSRSLRQTQAQFDQLRQRWSSLQPTGTG